MIGVISVPDFFTKVIFFDQVRATCSIFIFKPYLLTMNSTAEKLKAIIDRHMSALQAIPEEQLLFKPSPVKWSKKELIGHLIDSAQSNIRRFIVAQYEDIPTINYDQDKWVVISGYQQCESLSLIRLWYLLNWQICMILNNTSDDMLRRKCMTGELHTLEWLADDYVKHLLHHIHQVLDLDPVPYT
jgi:DinB superfamily